MDDRAINYSLRRTLRAGAGTVPGVTGRLIALMHKTEGLEIAGSGTRHVDHEAWGVIWTGADNATHGQWHTSLAAAEADFAHKTGE